MNESLRKQSAFTLVESIVAITLLAVIFGLFSMILIQGHNQFSYAVQLHDAVTLADIYMNEVLSTGRWDERSHQWNDKNGAIPLSAASIGPEENKRSDYDDCDDYNGFTSTGTHTYKNGQTIQGNYSGYTASIEVRFVNYGSETPVNHATNIKQITVLVTWSNNQQTRLTTVLANI